MFTVSSTDLECATSADSSICASTFSHVVDCFSTTKVQVIPQVQWFVKLILKTLHQQMILALLLDLMPSK